jgi:hypothetical protein
MVVSAMSVMAPLQAGERKRPQADAQKQRAIRELITVMGSAKMADQVMNQLLTVFQQQSPSVPNEFWTKIRANIKTGELMDMIVPIYDKYYTREDIDGLIAFYKSPLGRKVVTTMPAVMRDSMSAGQQWGQKLARQVISEMKRKGYKPPS